MDIAWIVYIFIAFVLSFSATALCMPVLLRLCKRRGLYDVPNERKVHHNNIPRLGGILFIPSMLVGVGGVLLLMMWTGGWHFFSINPTTLFIGIGMFMLYLIGLTDDLFGLRAGVKFAIQIVVAIFLPCCGLYIHNLFGLFGCGELPVWVAYPLTAFITLLIVNAVNLIDGIDGLASSLSLIAIVSFGSLLFRHGMVYYMLFCMSLAGTVLAFWGFNMFGSAERSTKTFMGDTGSLTLGYALAFLSIRYITSSAATSPADTFPTALLVPFTLLLVPCFDLVRVAVMRLLHGKPMFQPDKTHLHHKCMQAGFTMHRTLVLIVGLQLFFCLMNALLVKGDCNISLIVCLDVALFVAFNLWLDYRKSRQPHNPSLSNPKDAVQDTSRPTI